MPLVAARVPRAQRPIGGDQFEDDAGLGLALLDVWRAESRTGPAVASASNRLVGSSVSGLVGKVAETLSLRCSRHWA